MFVATAIGAGTAGMGIGMVAAGAGMGSGVAAGAGAGLFRSARYFWSAGLSLSIGTLMILPSAFSKTTLSPRTATSSAWILKEPLASDHSRPVAAEFQAKQTPTNSRQN